MGRRITVEVCLDSLESVRTVQRVSAHFEERVDWRIELCSNLIHGGGLTPSVGLLKLVRKLLPEVDIMVMIRPRIGSFVYNEDEIQTMEEEIVALYEAGATGFVFGCLTPEGGLDLPAMRRLCAAADGSEVTFHRAFDAAGNQDITIMYKQLDEILNLTRILTSGCEATAVAGLPIINTLLLASQQPPVEHNIKVLPGSGINAQMLPEFLAALPDLQEIHLTASEVVEDDRAGPSGVVGAGLGFGETKRWRMNEEKLRAVFQVIDDLQRQ